MIPTPGVQRSTRKGPVPTYAVVQSSPVAKVARLLRYLLSVQLLQKTLEINTQSMDQLRVILFKTVPTIRISEGFTQPEMATDLFEHNLAKLNILWQRGRESFAKQEAALREYLSPNAS